MLFYSIVAVESRPGCISVHPSQSFKSPCQNWIKYTLHRVHILTIFTGRSDEVMENNGVLNLIRYEIDFPLLFHRLHRNKSHDAE